MRNVRTLRVAAAVLALGAAVALGALGSGAATVHRVIVKPATGLKNDEIVKVSGTGFKPHDMVFIVECLSTAKGSGGCNIASATPATITGTGALPSTRFKVTTGRIGSGKCGTTAKNLKGCEVSVGNAAGKDTGSTIITFKLP